MDLKGLLFPRLWAPGWRTPSGCGRCCSTGRTSSPGAPAAPSKCGRCSPALSAGVEWGNRLEVTKSQKNRQSKKICQFVKAVIVTKIKHKICRPIFLHNSFCSSQILGRLSEHEMRGRECEVDWPACSYPHALGSLGHDCSLGAHTSVSKIDNLNINMQLIPSNQYPHPPK